jgi:hypothetical protein
VGADDGFVTKAECAGTQIPDAPLPPSSQGAHLRISGLKLLSLPTFFAAAKKVGAAPHRGNANKPEAIEEERDAPKQPMVRKRGYGARSAAGRMTALSLPPNVREHGFQMHHYRR